MFKKIFKNENIINYIIIFIVVMLLSIPMLNSDLAIYKDDGAFHLNRLKGTLDTILEGNLFPVIISNFCNEFGYSWNIFYSPLTSYLPLIFKLFTSSFIVCLKIYFVFVMFFSSFFMYKFAKQLTKNNNMAITSAIIYIISPYFLTDIYIRHSVAEATAFVFLPLVFLGIDNILNKNFKKSYYLAIGAIGLILSHLISTMITVFFATIYIIVNYKKLKNIKVIKYFIINLIFILLITSFYYMPLLEHKLATEYEVFEKNRMGSIQKLNENTIDPRNLIIAENTFIISEIGISALVLLAIIPLVFKKVKKEYKLTYIVFIIFSFLGLFVTTKWFNWNILPSFLEFIQFPWRMLLFTTFFISIICGINLFTILENENIKKISLILVLIFIIFPTIRYTKFLDITEFDDSFIYANVKLTTKTRLTAQCAYFEYLPSKVWNNREYIENRNGKIKIIKGTADIASEEKNKTRMKIVLNNVKDNLEIELPYIYYLGYNIKIKTEENENIKIKYDESDYGFIKVKIPDNIENAEIIVKYTGTSLMNITLIISVLGVIGFIIFIVYSRKFVD